MKKIFLLIFIIILSISLFISCAPITPPVPTPSEGEGEGEPTGDRVVLVELFNTEGCAASKVINPIMEELAQEYGTGQVILVEEAGWGKYSTPETMERFSWYVSGTKHTPFIAFNGLSETFSEGVVGGGGGGGTPPPPVNHAPVITSTPITTATVGVLYTYDVEATDPDGDTLTYSLTTGPKGMIIETATGLVTWTPDSNQTGKHNISVEISNESKKTTQNFTITVSERLYATAITNQVTDLKVLEKKIEYLKSKRVFKNSYSLNKPLPVKRGVTEYFIIIEWPHSFPNATGYKIYRKINSSPYEVIYTYENPSSVPWLDYYDYNVDQENSYTYYITAYNTYNSEPEEEIYHSNEATIDTWLPSCSLVSPVDNSILTEPAPVFTWNPVGLESSNFPHGSIAEGISDLWIFDMTSGSEAWWLFFNDMTTSSVTYNYDGRAASLVPNHNYSWDSWGCGYNENGDLIAMSWSEDWGFTTQLEVLPVRRALLVGVGDYMYGNNDLSAPPYDVAMMRDTLEHSGVESALISELIDLKATKNAILDGIANTFKGADIDDISYFYFTGHGALSGGISYLIPTDFDGNTSSAISVNELEAALSDIHGTKVIFLDSCHSGGFIGKEINQKGISDYLKDFNSNIINTFMSKDIAERDLAEPQYQVLTSCLSTQTAVELIPEEDNPYGLFSRVLCEGCGYDYYRHPYPADSNENGEITLEEAYNYTN